jgi:hypothetical protein
MPRWHGASALATLTLLLAGCHGATPERARIVDARVVRDGDGMALELVQELRFSRSMRDALAAGIPLRLGYSIEGCATGGEAFALRYSPLSRSYELLREGDARPRSFARRSALFAALDRVRLRLHAEPLADCEGSVRMALDLTALPTPLRFPAFLQPDEWRMVSPGFAWSARSPRA